MGIVTSIAGAVQEARSYWYWWDDMAAYQRDKEQCPWLFGKHDWVVYVHGRLRGCNMSLDKVLAKLSEEEQYDAYIVQHLEGDEVGHGLEESLYNPLDTPRR